KHDVASCVVIFRGSRGRHGVGAAMSAEQVESTIAFTVGFAIAGCWSLISGTVVVLLLAAFGVPAACSRAAGAAVRREIGGDDASRARSASGSVYCRMQEPYCTPTRDHRGRL